MKLFQKFRRKKEVIQLTELLEEKKTVYAGKYVMYGIPAIYPEKTYMVVPNYENEDSEIALFNSSEGLINEDGTVNTDFVIPDYDGSLKDKELFNITNDSFLRFLIFLFQIPGYSFSSGNKEKTDVYITYPRLFMLKHAIEQYNYSRMLYEKFNENVKVNRNWCQDVINKHFTVHIV